MKPAVGRVYVLSNKAMPGLLKIGYTMNTVEGRVKELSSSTGVPSEFIIEYQVECRDAASVEALVHESLINSRHNNSREFFSISLEDAVSEIRKNIKEIIDEEINGSIGSAKDSGKYAVTFYLVEVNSSKNIFRVGLINKNKNFLDTTEFKSMIIDLYNNFESNYFYGCKVILSNEFIHVDKDSLQIMREFLDGNLERLKKLNRDIFQAEGNRGGREYNPRLDGKYDLRTLSFKEYREAFPIQIYNSSLALLEPIAKASLDKSVRSKELFSEQVSADVEFSKRLDDIRKIGI
jgi:hypothetical protein